MVLQSGSGMCRRTRKRNVGASGFSASRVRSRSPSRIGSPSIAITASPTCCKRRRGVWNRPQRGSGVEHDLIYGAKSSKAKLFAGRSFGIARHLEHFCWYFGKHTHSKAHLL
eukprot:6184344-Pleurochrysis_carterae.AAC.1